jgi:hypothetical protein
MYSKFEQELPILEGDDSLRLGVCAMGPVADTDTITWMRVWMWQLDGEKVAASSGVSGTHPGAHPLAPTEELPFKAEKGWMIQTVLEPGSDEFSEGTPALAMAMALVVTDGDAEGTNGTRELLQWNQGVMVEGRRHHEYP